MCCLFQTLLLINRNLYYYYSFYRSPRYSSLIFYSSLQPALRLPFLVSVLVFICMKTLHFQLLTFNFKQPASLHDFLFLKRTDIVLCRRELFSKSRRIIDF